MCLGYQGNSLTQRHRTYALIKKEPKLLF